MSGPRRAAPGGRARVLLGLLLALLMLLPFVVNPYLLSVLTLILYLAYVGQAWNVMMGFAGQLSLGHSLYVGLGAYVSAALFVHYGVPPALGFLAAILVALVFGAAIGFLAFRFGVSGVYFALLTIAFAEFTRIGFDHFDWVGGSGGFFLKVAQRDYNDLVNLRGSPEMFYYLLLAMTAGCFLLCHRLMQSRIGFYWLAIREDQEAAQAVGIDVFRYKMLAVMLSAALASLAGVFTAFFNNNLFPFQIFGIEKSIEIILGPIIGGLGTLFGPILGAFVLTVLAEGLRGTMEALGVVLPGVKQVFYGICLLFVIMFLPHGIWPSLRRRLGLDSDGRR
ncbi:MAG: branched-chain amino acid ABC transporter permease [Alphaproteobacteria bacterium]|nr:branched-chain amino acid ABC transporter permease [Alphaproteobacteria bacterium]